MKMDNPSLYVSKSLRRVEIAQELAIATPKTMTKPHPHRKTENRQTCMLHNKHIRSTTDTYAPSNRHICSTTDTSSTYAPQSTDNSTTDMYAPHLTDTYAPQLTDTYRNLLNFEVDIFWSQVGMAKINHTKIVYTVWFLYNKHCKNENISKENLGIEIYANEN